MIVDYLEKEYIKGKHFATSTKNFLNATEKGLGYESLVYFFSREYIDRYLRSMKFNNQQHFEATIIALVKRNARTIPSDYKQHLREIHYDLKDEPADFSYCEKKSKKKKKYIF